MKQMTSLFNLAILVPVIFCLHFASCDTAPGDPNQYKEMGIEEISEKNVPKGMMLRDGSIYPNDGFELVQSKDSTRIMLISTGNGRGQTEIRCECAEGFGLTCLPTPDIIECSRLYCAKCKPVLRVYDSPIKFERSKW